jgi:uncharacterized repeat protein (TIGR03803 family)
MGVFRFGFWSSQRRLFFSGATNIRAQSISVLYNFSPADSSYINSDGVHPRDFVAYNGRIYGLTIHGGVFGNGVIYSVNLDGTDFRVLHTFGNEDAGRPLRPIIVSEGVIYGTTELGMGGGVIFAINTDGTNYRYVHEFAGDDGTRPLCELTLDGDTLYGTAADGGPPGVERSSPSKQMARVSTCCTPSIRWPTR